jgi:hypothetical protein
MVVLLVTNRIILIHSNQLNYKINKKPINNPPKRKELPDTTKMLYLIKKDSRILLNAFVAIKKVISPKIVSNNNQKLNVYFVCSNIIIAYVLQVLVLDAASQAIFLKLLFFYLIGL